MQNSALHKSKKTKYLTFLLLALLSFAVLPVYSGNSSVNTKTSAISSSGRIQQIDQSTQVFNAVWCFQRNVDSAMLQDLVSHKIFNVFVYVGYPNIDDDPRLEGIVPEYEIGILSWVTPENVASMKQLFASVDSRLRLWAWFGTWSDDPRASGDLGGHYYAKVNISTSYNRNVIIENIVKFSAYGFYGVQDDTEDILPDLTVAPQNLVNFWNEEQVALNKIGVKLAAFAYSGPPSLWWVRDYVSKLNVDYIIACPDISQSQEVIALYGPIEEIWKSEVKTCLSYAQAPVIFDTPSHYGGGSHTPYLGDYMEWLEEIDARSYPRYSGNAIYIYDPVTASSTGTEAIADSEWVAWDNFMTNYLLLD